jgi:hypothetical protein
MYAIAYDKRIKPQAIIWDDMKRIIHINSNVVSYGKERGVTA